MTIRKDIENFLWKACDTFKGKMDSSRYKDYILSMLFVKYLSDTCKENKEKYTESYEGDETRIEHAMKMESFYLDEKSTFDYLYNKRNSNDIGQIINVALNSIEEHNSGKLKDVFRSVDFNSTVDFGESKQKNIILKTFLEDFYNLDLRPSQLEERDIIADIYEDMIANFVLNDGKKGGESYTPSNVSKLIAKLIEPKENDRIYDPVCGSGGLLLKVFREVPSHKVEIYGQEKDAQTWSLCKMNMFLHNINDAQIHVGDTISDPKTLEDDRLMKFQVLVADPPFCSGEWSNGLLQDNRDKLEPGFDTYGRFEWGVPPKSKGEYAFILHMIKCMDDNTGRMAIVLPHGALFRGSTDSKIRKEIIENNLLDAVIGLPSNLFFGTSIPACILIMKKNRKNNDVLFIDASGEGNFEKRRRQNILRDIDIDKIVNVYKGRETIGKYSRIVTLDEIRENDYNLSIPRYVNTSEEEKLMDIKEVKRNIENIEKEIKTVQEEIKKYLKELDV